MMGRDKMTIDIKGKTVTSNAAILFYYKAVTKGRSLYGDIATMAPHFQGKKQEDIIKALGAVDITGFFMDLYVAARCVAERRQLNPVEVYEELPTNILSDEEFINGITEIINELLDTNSAVKKK